MAVDRQPTTALVVKPAQQRKRDGDAGVSMVS
jgi:hypothetical protein